MSTFGTGEVWPGPEAKELGLVDGVASVVDFVATHWGMKTYDYGPSADSSPFLTRSLQDAIAGAVRRLALSGPTVQ